MANIEISDKVLNSYTDAMKEFANNKFNSPAKSEVQIEIKSEPKIEVNNHESIKSVDDSSISSSSSESPEGSSSSVSGSESEDSSISSESSSSSLSTFEDAQRTKGWVPKHEFKGDPETWVDAKEFARVGSIFKRMKEQGEELRVMKDMLRKTTEHLTNTQKVAYERAIKDLETRKFKAVETADTDQFRSLEAETKNLHDQMEKDPLIHSNIEVAPVVDSKPKLSDAQQKTASEFAEKHKFWLTGQDKESDQMRKDCDFIDKALTQRALSQGMSIESIDPKHHFKMIESQLQTLYPHKFTNPARNAPSAVVKSTATKENLASSLVSKLDPMQREIGEFIAKSSKGKYSLEKYADDLQKQGKLK